MRSALLMLALGCSLARGVSANTVEIRLVHGYEESGRSHKLSDCDSCREIAVSDPLGRADTVVVREPPDVVVSFPAIRALVALTPEERAGKLHRVLLFVDSSTQTDLERLRGQAGAPFVLVSVGSHRSLGRLDAKSPWQIDAGFFGARSEWTTLFAAAPAPHFVLEPELIPPPPGASQPSPPRRCTESAIPPVERRPSDATLPLWVQGTMREGLKHGLWVFVDHRGELVQLLVYQWGCLVETVLPFASEDDLQLRELEENRPRK